MKLRYKHIALIRLCRLLGITSQAYYQHFKHQNSQQTTLKVVLSQVYKIRDRHPRMGGRKIYRMIQSFLHEHQIKMGRDAFFKLLEINNLLVVRKKRKVFTTNSQHHFHKYPNLIKQCIPDRVNQLWVSDITYWKINSGYVYISLITDAYSRKIIGYHVAKTLEATGTVQALKMALRTIQTKPISLIHHSDRGLQYCCRQYTQLLRDSLIQISMTENGDPYENALAERVNGILKEEYLNEYSVHNLNQAKMTMDLVVRLYNEERPHMSCGYQTPEIIHSRC
ncbi:IS3 family transposase [Chryseolinea soli]|uniref:IS3 family transposase n=1 Tax=Chryseolinea soli TaxID=2321403 RepID=A0A385SUX4_9BACT|nr:IS3 family transposase [Chryseolinea soli]AYB30991.1 IS3 family transposase [Chryseolinea soli]AYB33464.1 IS3 family transposase [Chryseolinea soli]AYB34094.1 IS3 family transposase [Chryseolinea soli]AYB34346.1 IS3 family transposase [Chryseolinea soli]AYB35288.1 IS3 family transposase [Chryseolinea soli]